MFTLYTFIFPYWKGNGIKEELTNWQFDWGGRL